MATTFYPTDTAASESSSSWTTAVEKELSLSRGAGVVDDNRATTSTTMASTDPPPQGGSIQPWGAAFTASVPAVGGTGAPADAKVWISKPLSAVTVSGTITCNIRASESSAMANYGVGALIFKVLSGNGSAAMFGKGLNTTELGTAESARTVTITPTSTALAAGDMLAVWMFWCQAGGANASGFNCHGFYAGTTAAASGDTWVQFTETITEQSGAAPTSLIYATYDYQDALIRR